MPKIQGTNRTVQTNTARLTPASTAGYGASGRATQQLGKAVAQAGNAIANSFGAVQDKNDELNANIDSLKFIMDQDQSQYVAGKSIDLDGRDHVNKSLGRFDAESNAHLQTVPEKQRGKVQLAHLRARQRIQNEAQRQQTAHQDTYWTGRLVDHGGNTIKTMITPESLNKDGINAGRGAIAVIDKAIDDAPLSPAKKQAMKLNARKKAAEEFAQKVDPVRYKKMLAARESTQKVLEKPTGKPNLTKAPDYRGQKGPAAIRYNNPGAQWPGPSAKKFGMTHSVTLKDGQNNKIAVFPTMIHGAAAQFDLLNRRYTGMTLGRAIKKWSGGNHWRNYVAGVTKRTGISSGTVITKEMLQNPQIAIPLTKAMSQHEVGRKGVMSDGNWVQAHKFFMSGGKGDVASFSQRASTGDAFTDTLFNDKNRKIVDKRWKDGIKAQVQTSMKGKPSIALENNIDALHDLAEKDPNNEGIKIALKEAETFKKQQSTALRTDPLKYADDQGLIEVPSLIGQQDQVKAISERIQQGDKVADTYQIEPKYLRQEEKAFISKQYHEMEPQDKVEFLAGIDKGAGAKAKKFLSELSDIDPSFAHVGGLYLMGRKEAAMLAMQGMELMKDKSLKDITERLKSADVSTAFDNYIGNTFGLNGIKSAGPFISTAKSIALAKMVQDSSLTPAEALEEGMKRATGHTEVNGEQYGGVIEFNDQKLMVHPDHKASDYEALFDYLTTGEGIGIDPLSLGKSILQSHGVMEPDAPKDGRGNFFLKKDGVNPTNPITQRPITAEDLNDAQIVSVGAGRYLIMVDGMPLLDTRKAENLGDSKNKFATGSEYILDLGSELEEILKLIRG